MLKCNLGSCTIFAAAKLLQHELVLVAFRRRFATPSPHQDVLLREYFKKLETNEYSLDQKQLNVVYRLNEFHKQVSKPDRVEPVAKPKKARSLFSFFAKRAEAKPAVPKTKGIYLYGGVGCGKTMLMDMTFDLLPAERTKLRIHFNKFMLRVHQSIHALKSQSAPSNPRLRASDEDEATMMDMLADRLIAEHSLLFFDEFQVTGIADAMLMSGLFTALFERGMVCFFTSNRAPADLYLKGLQRELFLPFIDVLSKYCDVICLDSPVDYRKLTGESLSRVYFNSDTEQFLLNHLIVNMVSPAKKSEKSESAKAKSLEETLNEAFKPVRIEILGREVVLERCAGRILDTSFSFLCEESRSSVDYIHLCKMFDVIIVRDVPIVSLHDPNSFRRFISFIDNVYDNRVRLVLSAKSTSPFKLIDRVTKSSTYEEEIFAVDRTVSRLLEMQSESYAKANKFSCQKNSTGDFDNHFVGSNSSAKS